MAEAVPDQGGASGERRTPPKDREATAWYGLDPSELLGRHVPTARRLAGQILKEFGDLRVRLVQKDPQLFSTYDRLESEAEFREASFIPLIAIVVAIAFDTATWPIIAIAVAPFLLLLDGISKRRDASAVLVQVLTAGVVDSKAVSGLEAEIERDIATGGPARRKEKEERRAEALRQWEDVMRRIGDATAEPSSASDA